MASGTQLASSSIRNAAEQEYLRLLQAQTPKEIEDRVVGTLSSAVNEVPHRGPVRLSRIADRFLINPQPRLIKGDYDGEIKFDENLGAFIISLCVPDPNVPYSKLQKQNRLRFTYAHEVAHRFFYVKEGRHWHRSRDMATAHLDLPDQMEQRITLGRLEERLCNKIAGRVLIPDHYISQYCNLEDWFADTSQFFERLTRHARTLGVSLDALMVRLRSADVRIQIGSNIALLIGNSAGPINARANFTLRVLTALSPATLAGITFDPLYPGIEIEKFGQLAAHWISGCIGAGTQHFGSIRIRMTISRKANCKASIDGHWRLIPGHPGEGRRMLLCGRLEVD